MRIKVTGIIPFFMLLCLTFGAFGQLPPDGQNEMRLSGVNPRVTALLDTITADAGRGITVAANPDLDGDGNPEIIVTEYTQGGRVFVYELVGNSLLEQVWVSPALSDGPGPGSTPRSVTTGDFDNNGRMEIIFPVGYSSGDSLRGIYFYEFTGNDNDYGTEPVYKMEYSQLDTSFNGVSVGRTESGLMVRDIDGDGKSELLFPPRAFSFAVAKLYIMEVESGTFSGGDAVVDNEYTYTDMVNPPIIAPDGYIPVGTEIGDVDNDGKDEIIVAGWNNIGSGAGVGFIEISGPDTYTPGSIVVLSTFSAFVVKAKPIFAMVNGAPVIYIHGSANAATRTLWTIDGIISDQFVSDANVTELMHGVGYYSAWAMGDQDHSAGNSDGLDFYIYGGGGRLLDIEYNGTGAVTDSTSYTITQLYDLADYYDNVGGLFNDFYCYPGMDLDNDGLLDLVAGYKGSGVDSLGGRSLAKDGYHVFVFEFGDSTTSINPDDITGVNPFRIVTPDNYELSQNYPNPFNPTTSIDFTLPISKEISLKVYNALGQEVRSLINSQSFSAGTHTMQWDGRDNSGQQVASGIYIYKLTFGNFSKSRKMTLVR
ncbi:MAG TPA: FG-GAP-like repeat-containing protein [Calditrichia bacterium]|nr:VCBS repeat-containing protein [Calditrichota bacterium]HQU73173.1 FG-GAP-like repeat-containing protein [Calditrichia bacterium]HQV30446.1 FG-GAP-like repeat-containing protein [Calditrichia bacterium]